MKLLYDCYFAGAMYKWLGKDVLAERESAKTICRQLGIKYYDPAEDEFIKPHLVIDVRPNLKRMKGFVKKGFKNLDKCKTVVVLIGDTSSSGTLWGMARMHYKHGRPIVLVAPRIHDRQPVDFTTILATKICATQPQALRWLKRNI